MTDLQENRMYTGDGSKDRLQGRKTDELIAQACREGGGKTKTRNSCCGFTKINHTRPHWLPSELKWLGSWTRDFPQFLPTWIMLWYYDIHFLESTLQGKKKKNKPPQKTHTNKTTPKSPNQHPKNPKQPTNISTVFKWKKKRIFQSPQKRTNLNNFLTSSNWRMQWRISCQVFLRIVPSYYSAHQNDENVLFGESLSYVSWSKISSLFQNFLYQNGRVADGLGKKSKTLQERNQFT